MSPVSGCESQLFCATANIRFLKIVWVQVATIIFNLKFVQFCVRTFLSPATSSSQWVWDLRTCYRGKNLWQKWHFKLSGLLWRVILCSRSQWRRLRLSNTIWHKRPRNKMNTFPHSHSICFFRLFFSGNILVEINPEGIKLNIIKITTSHRQSLQTECEKQKVNILEKWTQFYWYTSIIRLHYCIQLVDGD